MITRKEDYEINTSLSGAGVLAKSFMSNVFLWMFLALAITALMAYLFANNEQLIRLIYQPTEYGTRVTLLGWVVFLSPFAFVLLMSFGYQRLSAGSLTFLFVVFATLLGMSLSSIFMVYTTASIFKTFIVTAAMFGFMAFLGYTTKTDLTKLGSLLFMALIGMIIAMVINWFMSSQTLDYVISIAGVIIFTGLTAYDVQKLKRIGMGIGYDNESTRKLVIMGALSLYLDFINLFLFLLRFLGNRR